MALIVRLHGTILWLQPGTRGGRHRKWDMGRGTREGGTGRRTRD